MRRSNNPASLASHARDAAQADGGRPFIVGGELRCAAPVGSAAWCGQPHRIGRNAGSPRVRQAVAEHYARAGLMEHASIASFARFVLQLVAVGAPPEMILDAQVAMSDEVRHAQACFAIARAYGGHALGPGPLGIDGALTGHNDLLGVTRAVIREGCVGETLAALEVEEAATWAREAELASALASIAEDELAHARLAWRFVAWALLRLGADDRETIGRCLWDAIGRARHAEPGRPHHDLPPVRLRAHGVLCQADRLAVRERALATMVEPSAAALLASGQDSRVAETGLV